MDNQQPVAFKKMLARLRRRMQMVSLARTYFLWMLILTVVYLLAVMLTRLTSLVSQEIWIWPLAEPVLWETGWFNLNIWIPTTLILPMILAFIPAFILHRRPTVEEAAAVADGHAQTQDLFLTGLKLEDAPGAYAPLVAQRAEKHAAQVKASKAVEYRPWKRAMLLFAICVLTGGLAAFTPAVDAFGKQEEKELLQQREKTLAELRKSTELRDKQLSKKLENPNDTLKKSMDDVKRALGRMKPKTPNDREAIARNKNLLDRERKKLDEEYNKRKAEQLNNTRKSMDRKFGVQDRELRKAANELKQGNATTAQQEMDKLKKMMEQMEKTSDPAEKRKLKKQIENKLRDMADMAEQQMGGKQMAQALERAADQMKNSGQNNQQGQQALKDAMKSMDLAKKEAQNTAQMQQDMQRLTDAMQALQDAQKANNQGLTPEQLQQLQGAEDMQEMQEALEKIAKQQAEGQPGGGGNKPGDPQNGEGDQQGPGNTRLAQNGEGQNQGNQPGNGNGMSRNQQQGHGGMGGEGQGQGGQAPENDAAKTKFKTEKVKTHLVAGKILADMKAKGEANLGDSTENYSDRLREVRDGVEEAILREDTPPGYRDSIKKYFESLEE